MLNIQRLNEIFDINDTIILGGFSTLHLGHQKLINRAQEISSNITLMRVNFGQRLLTNKEVNFLIEKNKWNISNIFDLNMDEIKNITDCSFINILKKNNIKNIVCGPDFKFGVNRHGDVELLKKYFNVNVVDFHTFNGEKVATKTIINKLQEGDLDYFEKTNGYKYFVYGTVQHGDKIGRTIDFPTININVDDKITPNNGVYNTNVEIEKQMYYGATYFGNRPTVNGSNKRCETNIIDFSSEIYDSDALVEIVEMTRGDIKFNGLDELKSQIRKDIDNARRRKNN